MRFLLALVLFFWNSHVRAISNPNEMDDFLFPAIIIQAPGKYWQTFVYLLLLVRTCRFNVPASVFFSFRLVLQVYEQ